MRTFPWDTQSFADHILVQNPQDHKIRVIKFGPGGSWRQIKCERSKVVGDSKLQAGDEIYAYFSASQHTKQGWYKAIVRGVYSTEKDCKEAESKLKQETKLSSKKRKQPLKIDKGRMKQLRRIVEPKDSSESSGKC